jgi:hypothetical protein
MSAASADAGGAPGLGLSRTNSLIRRRVTAGREQGLAGGDHAHCVEKPLGGDVLEQEAAGPGAQCVEHVLIQVERGKDKDPRPRFSGPG